MQRPCCMQRSSQGYEVGGSKPSQDQEVGGSKSIFFGIQELIYIYLSNFRIQI